MKILTLLLSTSSNLGVFYRSYGLQLMGFIGPLLFIIEIHGPILMGYNPLNRQKYQIQQVSLTSNLFFAWSMQIRIILRHNEQQVFVNFNHC
jgi:hypothetical protein